MFGWDLGTYNSKKLDREQQLRTEQLGHNADTNGDKL